MAKTEAFSWRNEPLSKGEVYDVLMKVADDVEQMTQHHFSKRLTHLFKVTMINDIIRNAAETLRNGRE